jgi:hypothetical protein
MTPEICPNCGEVVPPKAKACPECGACEETGWSDEGRADALDLPSEEFDYDDYVKREFEGEKLKRKFGAVWIITAIVLLALFAWVVLGPHLRK